MRTYKERSQEAMRNEDAPQEDSSWQARFPGGTFERINAVLVGKEDRTDFVREAVKRELRRRERAGDRPKAEKRNG